VAAGAGTVTVSGNTVTNDIDIVDNSPGGATVENNSDANCHQGNNHPYSGSGNNVAGNCNGSNN
jgi:hypothetical protein